MPNKTKVIFSILIITFLFVITLSAEDLVEKKKNKYAILPQMGYGDETGLLLGFLSFYRAEYKNNSDLSNQINLVVVATQRGQIQVQLNPEYYFMNGHSYLSVNAKYRKWPTYFYGVANSDANFNGLKYTPQKFEFSTEYNFKLRSNFSLSLLANQLYNITLKQEDSDFMNQFPGFERYFLSGLGLGFAWDTRDKTSFAEKGMLAKIQMISHRKWIGSDYGYEQFQLDLREFISLKKNHILAFQQVMVYSSMVYSSDEMPFEKMFKAGDYARVFPSNIFLDRHGIAFRSEYRMFPFSGYFWERIGFVAFFDTAKIANELNKISFNNFHYSFGLGFRYSFFLKDRFNLSVDFGRTSNGSGIDISGGDTF